MANHRKGPDRNYMDLEISIARAGVLRPVKPVIEAGWITYDNIFSASPGSYPKREFGYLPEFAKLVTSKPEDIVKFCTRRGCIGVRVEKTVQEGVSTYKERLEDYSNYARLCKALQSIITDTQFDADQRIVRNEAAVISYGDTADDWQEVRHLLLNERLGGSWFLSFYVVENATFIADKQVKPPVVFHSEASLLDYFAEGSASIPAQRRFVAYLLWSWCEIVTRIKDAGLGATFESYPRLRPCLNSRLHVSSSEDGLSMFSYTSVLAYIFLELMLMTMAQNKICIVCRQPMVGSGNLKMCSLECVNLRNRQKKLDWWNNNRKNKAIESVVPAT